MTPKIKKLIRDLRVNFPTDRPVSFRFKSMKKDCGYMHFSSAGYSISIATDQSERSQIDAIFHEYAHAHSIDQSCRHSVDWGETYSALYRAWERGFK